MNQAPDSTTTFLTGVLPRALVVAVVLTLAVSIGALALYRRAVLRSMRTRTEHGITSSVLPKASPSSVLEAPTAAPVSAVDPETSATAGPDARALESTVLRAPWRIAAIYLVAGLCSALVLALGSSRQVGDLSWLRILMLLYVYAWPVVLTVNLVAAASWRARVTTASVYFAGLVLVAAIVIVRSPEFSAGQAFLLWSMANLVPTILMLAFLNRRVRAVGPLVLTFMLLAVLGSYSAPFALAEDERLFNLAFEAAYAVGLGTLPEVTRVLGFAVFAVGGLLALRLIRRRYDGKKVSDQSITIDSIWLLFVLAYAVPLVFEGVAWILWGLVAFAVYKFVTRIGFGLLSRRASRVRRDAAQLLLLRVFSLGRRSERLFDALAIHWRHAGDIRLIAGPDLAKTTVEPHEFMDFLSRKLARRFIDGDQALELRISEMDVEPDRDGRYRVNDFFCHEDTWQDVLSRLVSGSDAVLMDLRGFSAQNSGVVFEINELINLVPVGRVVFVVDQTTDERFLRETVKESWRRMRETSPNRSASPEQLRLLPLSGVRSGELRQLLRTICAAAAGKPAASA